MYRILHLSDIHIGKTFDSPKQIGARLANNIKSECGRKLPDRVIVTGDIFEKTEDKSEREKKIKKALMLFDAFLKAFNDEENGIVLPRKRFMFIPGNHDIFPKDKKGCWSMYDEFLKRFYASGKGKRRLPSFYSYEDGEHMVFDVDDANRIILIGLESCLYNSTDGTWVSEISETQIDIIDKKMKETDYADYYKVAFFHYPFYIFSEAYNADVGGIVRNSERLGECLAQWGVKLVLHGHKHLARESVVWPRKTQRIDVIAAGSLCSGDVNTHSCNIIGISDSSQQGNENRLNLVRMENSDGKDYKKKKIPIKIEEGMGEGLLCEKLGGRIKAIRGFKEDDEEDVKDDFKSVLEIADCLYQDYDSLYFLQNDEEYLKLFVGGIYYCLGAWNSTQTTGDYGTKRKKDLEDTRLKILKDFEDILLKNLDEDCKADVLVMMQKRRVEIHENVREELDRALDKKRVFAFLLLTTFVTDLYITFAKEWDKSWKSHSPIRTPDKNMKAQFSGNGAIRYDRAAGIVYIRLKVHSAEAQVAAHRVVDEFKNRFDWALNYLSCIGFNTKRIHPDIENDDINEVGYYEMDASIPHMVHLLTGTNIYTSDHVFVRELVQNAIDAISFREKLQGKPDFSNSIRVSLGMDSEGEYFRISDHGIGMGREIISHYFTTIGKSFYKEYGMNPGTDLEYNSISNFGIGFLSVFRPCRKIVVRTRHSETGIYYKMEIREDQDYFLAERPKDDTFQAGTEITCYFKDGKEIEPRELLIYLQRIMRDIKYPIEIFSQEWRNPKQIQARMSRIGDKERRLFIPFEEEKECVVTVNSENLDADDDFALDYRHGFLMVLDAAEGQGSASGMARVPGRVFVLNAGILMEGTDAEDVLRMDEGQLGALKYNEITINFPPKWIEIDVSREKSTGFRSMHPKVNAAEQKGHSGLEEFRNQLYASYRSQMEHYVSHQKDATLAALFEAEQFMRRFCGIEPRNAEHEGIIDSQLELWVKFGDGSIEYTVKAGKEMKDILADGGFHGIAVRFGDSADHPHRIHSALSSVLSAHMTDDLAMELVKASEEGECGKGVEDFLKLAGVNEISIKKQKCLPVVLAAFLDNDVFIPDNGTGMEKDHETIAAVKKLVIRAVLESYTVADLEEGRTVSVRWEEKKEARRTMVSDSLGEIVKRVASLYGAKEDINRYAFIWNKIFRESYRKHYQVNTADWRGIERSGQGCYLEARDRVKGLYADNTENLLIDGPMIASCYVDALLQIPSSKLGKPIRPDVNVKCEWILDCATQFLYVWNLAEYKESDPALYKKWRKKKCLEWPKDQSQHERYIMMLSRCDAYREKFDILAFSELLHWLLIYNENKMTQKKRQEGRYAYVSVAHENA